MNADPVAFALSWNKDQPDALERLEAALEAAREERGCHAAWARLCDEAGQDALALTEYQLARRDAPGDLHALERLSVLYRERGEAEKALECAEHRAALRPSDAVALRDLVDLYLENDMVERAEAAVLRAADSGISSEAIAPLAALVRASSRAPEGREDEEKIASSIGVPSDADVTRFAHLFAGRENIYARQWWNESGEGGYTPVRQPATFQVFRNHLLGGITIGAYLVRLDNTVTFFAFDIDINKRALARARGSPLEARKIKESVSSEARRLQAELAGMGIPTLLEDSGYKGRHLWTFLGEPVEAGIVRQFGTLFMGACPLQSLDLHCEFFPKQASAGSGVGNLIKLPLGIHRRTGRRSRFLFPDGSADPDPFRTLRSVSRLPREKLFDAIVVLKGRRVGTAPVSPEEEEAAAPPVPAPPTPPPCWTEADFETHPEVSHLIRSCAVIGALRDKVQKYRRLSHDERVVLIHSMGHSAAGVMAVNHLFAACVDVPAELHLQTPLSGSPISCPKIRKRIPQITGQVDCNCSFDFASDRYPTPLLHLLAAPKARAAPGAEVKWDPVERTRALGVLRLRRAQVEREIAELEKALMEFLAGAGQERIDLEEGALVLRHEDGAPPSLDWQPKTPADGRVGPGGE